MESQVVVRQGRIRWREHEMILVAILTVIQVAGYIMDMLTQGERQIEGTYRVPYYNHQVSFHYYKNVLLPQVGVTLLLYLCYLGINRIIIPLVRRISLKDTTGKVIQKITFAVIVFLSIGYLLALGINLATHYAHPWYFNYGGFQQLSILGYNDQPLVNLWAGFDRAVPLVAVFCGLAGIREVIIYYIERTGPKRSYVMLVLNQLTTFGVIYISILSAMAVFNVFVGPLFRVFYLSFIPATFLVFMANTYWLFPWKRSISLFNYRTLVRLLLSTFLFTVPFFIGKGVEMPHNLFVFFMNCWGMQLFITTPVSWLIYQQRKDKILQLRGVEKELVRSKADLQFLRSQINPHFLFNVLNTLYGTALREKARDTAEGVQKLGDMMRFMLHENTLDFISMHREIEYLKNYISLQKLRTQASPGIVIEDNITEASCNHLIAPMILIPFVENAFKHGISLKTRSWINISLVCDEKYIRFEVRNSMHPGVDNDPEKESSGIGLKNVLERLALAYPGKHEISINTNAQEFIVHLSIQP